MEEVVSEAAGLGSSMVSATMRELVMEASALARLALPPSPGEVAWWLGIEITQARAVLDGLDDEGMIDTTRGFRAWSEFAMLELHDRRVACKRPLPQPPAWDNAEPDPPASPATKEPEP